MLNIPNRLTGASLGEAHEWVREQLLATHGKVLDYTLTDENGNKISLGDLTKGTTSHVTINTRQGTTKTNPAHPAELAGFMEVPTPMYQARLTALTESDLTPALYNSMVEEYGLFGATQILSILLTRPVSPALRYPLRTSQLIKARKGESLLPAHRFIPPPTGISVKGDKKSDNRNRRNQRGRSNPSSGFSTMSSSAVVFDSLEEMLEESKSNPGHLRYRFTPENKLPKPKIAYTPSIKLSATPGAEYIDLFYKAVEGTNVLQAHDINNIFLDLVGSPSDRFPRYIDVYVGANDGSFISIGQLSKIQKLGTSPARASLERAKDRLPPRVPRFSEFNDPRSNPSKDETIAAYDSLGLGRSIADVNANLAPVRALQSNKTASDIKRFVDSALDGVEVKIGDDDNAEAGALLSVFQELGLTYDNSRDIFDNFAQKVLAPYLVTSAANVNALKYINEYILPSMRTLVSNSGRKSDANLRKLDASYRALVKRLATDPKDFYMGKELALIAHPGFLFPRAGLVLFPMPTNLKDSTFKAFQQMQRPVEYDRESGAIKVVSGAEEHIKYLDQAEQQQLSKKEFNTSRLTDRIYSILDKVSRSLDTSDINKSAFNTLIAETQEAAALATEAERFRAMEDQQAFYFTDLPGIRPIPTNWPQQFVLSMMETLGRHKDKLTGLGGGEFNATNFLVPSGINMGVGPVGKFSEKFETVGHFVSRLNELEALGLEALSRDGDENEEAIAFLKDIKPRFRGIASTVLEADFGEGDADAQIQAVIDANAEAAEDNSVGALIARLVVVKPNLLMNSAFLGSQTIIAPKQYSAGPSIYQLLQEAFKLSELKYNYTPTKNDIRFMVVLVYYSLSQMNLHSDVSTVFDDIRETFELASDAFSTRFIERVNADLPALGEGVIDEASLRAYLAHIVARELLDDEDGPEEEEEEVFANPHEPGHIDTPAITAGARTRMRNNLNDVINSMETKIRGTINEPIIEALHEAIIPEMVASLREGRRYFRPLDEPGPDKADIISAVEDLFGEARIAVESHISNLNELCLAILTDEPIAAVEAATRAVRSSTIQITTIDDVSTSLDQLMTLGVDADNPPPQTEINYVAQMKEFMRLIGNELHFTHDAVNDIMSDFAEVDRLQTLFPSDLVSLLMDEYTAMRDIMLAFDDTTISYRRYLRGYAQSKGLTVDANLRLRRAGGGFAPDIGVDDRAVGRMYRQDRARPRVRRGPGILQGVELLQSRIFDLLTLNFPGLVDGSMYQTATNQAVSNTRLVSGGSNNRLAMQKLYQTQTAENEIGYLLYNGFQATDLDDSLLNYLKTLLNKMDSLGSRNEARRVLREELSVMADEVSVTLIKQLESIFGKGKAFSRSSLNYIGRQLGRVFNVGSEQGGPQGE
tara:strand:- start:4623 stop:8777 length:4155 start_codon:yes stop_codon:yes gene_type:complete